MMIKNLNILNEISNGVSAKQSVQLKVEYACETKKDMEIIAQNITNILLKDIDGIRLAKITYDIDTEEKVVRVEFIQHD